MPWPKCNRLPCEALVAEASARVCGFLEFRGITSLEIAPASPAYMCPRRTSKSEDEIIAEALKLGGSHKALMEVRNALCFDTPLDNEWILTIFGGDWS